MKKSEHDALVRMAEHHEQSADAYAVRSHETEGDISDGYSALSEAHNGLAKAIREKTGTTDPRR